MSYFDTTQGLREAEYVVEATRDEQHLLWYRWYLQPNTTSAKIGWEEISMGQAFEVGVSGGRPIWISITFARINGVLVLFWRPSSQVVDYVQIKAWLEANVPAYTATTNRGWHPRCDVSSFANCLTFTQKRAEERAV